MENRKQPYKYLLLLLVLYITFLLLTISLANRITYIFGMIQPGGIYIFSLTFPILDIIAEVYGYSYSRFFIWMGALSEILFAVFSVIISNLPSPDFFTHSEAYKIVFDPTIRFVASSLIGTICGEFVNTYLLVRWKLKFQGRIFVLRCIGSTILGQAVLTIIVDLLAFTGKMSLSNLVWMMLCGYLWKLGYALLFLFPTWLLTKYIKNTEKINNFDLNVNFNPFKLDIEEGKNIFSNENGHGIETYEVA